MDKLIILLIVILWAVLQARRKAIREQARKQAQQERAPQPMPRRATQQAPRVLGAVTAEENRRPAERPIQRYAERAKEMLAANEMPEEVRGMMQVRQSTQAQPETQEERVDEIVPPASESPYETSVRSKPRISLSQEALRTFIVTREILGPARFRNPHRRSIRSK